LNASHAKLNTRLLEKVLNAFNTKIIYHRDTENTELNIFFPAGRRRPGKIIYPALLEIKVLFFVHRTFGFLPISIS